MLPCQQQCPQYQRGCHKTCARWKTFQAEQQARRQAQKAYLKFYGELCSAVTHQLVTATVRRAAR